MADFIQIAAEDNVEVALRDSAGIPMGHKRARTDIPAGASIVKYGAVIGHATAPIPAGGHVHTHNMATNLQGERPYVYEEYVGAGTSDSAEPATPPEDRQDRAKAQEMGGAAEPLPDSFLGYLRPDGRAGTRNEIWILPVVGCVNDVAARLAREAQALRNAATGDADHWAEPCDKAWTGVDGIYSFAHPYGCSQTGEDHARTRKLLASLARHPNAGGVLFVHLGCENCTHEQLLDELGDYDPRRVRFLHCQRETDEIEAGLAMISELVDYAGSFRRERVSVSRLVVGMKCGGSDGLSGITANPLVGSFSDRLIGMGGSTLLTEVPEMFGAEHMLLSRCASREVFGKAAEMLNGFKRYFLSHGEKVYENPSPGNRAGGITTLEDKSCGCIQKGGTAPVRDVIDYGDTVRVPGLTLLCGPGNDLVSATALSAAGAQIILFTTGRGTPFGAPAPTVKISSNSALAAHKSRWIDFDAGVLSGGDPEGGMDLEAEGKSDTGMGAREAISREELADRLYCKVLEVASGAQTASERSGYRSLAIWKDGVTL